MNFFPTKVTAADAKVVRTRKKHFAGYFTGLFGLKKTPEEDEPTFTKDEAVEALRLALRYDDSREHRGLIEDFDQDLGQMVRRRERGINA